MNAPSEAVQNVSLDEMMDISSAAELQARLLEILKKKLPVCVNGKNVERVDTAALQIMMAFIEDAKTQGQSVQWQEPSVALIQSAGLLGLSHLLGLDERSA